jgi:predicted RNase H-like nuclease
VSDQIRYLGIDLAWSEAAASGVCALDARGRVLTDAALPPAALSDWIREWRAGASVIAVDGPLVVPPSSGALRPVEIELHRRYGGRHAGPFPGGAASTAMRGRHTSPAAALLNAVGGYVVDPLDLSAPHRAIEVFPAPTWIEVFQLERRVIYKRGRLADRIAALGQLQALLASLGNAGTPLGPTVGGELGERLASARTAREWKSVEDILDARLCAYVALLWGRDPRTEWIVTGDGTWTTGYVVVPQLATEADHESVGG